MTTPNRGTPPTRIGPSAAQPQSPNDDGNGGIPETVRYLLSAWLVMVAGELLHQLLTIVMLVLDPSALRQAAKEANESMSQDVPAEQVDTAVWLSVGIMGLLTLAIVVGLAVALNAVVKQKSWAEGARGMLMAFSVFFALRVVVVFMSTVQSGTGVPTAVIAADGILQILIGVAAVCALVFASQDEAKKWVAKDKPRPGTNEPTRES